MSNATVATTTIAVGKTLGGTRASTADQFTVGVSGIGSSTTGGSGSTVTGGGTGNLTVTGGTAYTITEASAGGANLSRYNSTIICTDANGLTSGLPSGATFNPATGYSITPATGAAISCTITNTPKPATLSVSKALGGARANTADQFTVGVSGVGTSTTSGSGSTVSGGATGALSVTGGTAYTITEAASGGANLNQYNSTISCSDANGFTSGLPSGATFNPATGYSITPGAASAISCTITNTPKPATLSVSKALGGARANTADQFTVEVSGVGTSTTSGTGSTVTGGATGALGVTGGTAYTITEAASGGTNLNQYNSTISCSDANGFASGLPSGATFNPATGYGVTPKAGSAILCTITNTPKAATIAVSKALGGARVNAADQFTVGVSGVGTSTTSGSGSSVTGGATGVLSVTGGTAYTITEAASGGTNLNQYNSTISCTDANGFASGLPSGAAFNPATGYSITPGAASVISCTITNTPKTATLQLAKSWGSGSFASHTATIGATTGGSSNTSSFSTTGGTAASSNVVSVTVGNTVTLPAESLSGVSASAYTTTLSCLAGGGATANSLSGTNGQASNTLVIGASDVGKAIVCTYTNTLKAPTLAVQKGLGASRASGSDQFVLGVSGTGAPASVTTTGTGSAITSSALSFTTTSGSYTINEAMAAGSGSVIGQYNSTISCSDANGIQAGLPSGATFNPATGYSITPMAGAAISCTIINTSKPATIAVSKALGGARVGAGDQFTVGVSGVTTSTTSGTGSSVTGGSFGTTVTVGTAYTITEAAAGGANLANYTSTISCSDANGYQSGLPNGAVFNTASGYTVTPVAGAAIACTITNTPLGGLAGHVFIDTGAGGGTANDGIRNGLEAGLSNITIKLTDCGGTLYGSTITDGAGNWRFASSPVAPGNLLCVEQVNVGGYISTGASVAGVALPSGTSSAVGGVSYTYSRISVQDRVALTWAASASINTIDFGDVPPSLFSANGNKTALPGTTVNYAHSFTAGTSGTVTFSLPSAVATPANAGWSQSIYADPTCSGELQAGAVQLFPPLGTGQAMTPGEETCIIMRQFVPADAPVSSHNDATVEASFVFSAASPSLTATYTLQDVTTVSNAALELKKAVRNITTGGNFGTTNEAKSGDVLEYRITFTNNAASPISGLAINDTIPAYSTFVTAGAGSLPSALSACQKTTPANPAPAPTVDCSALQAVGGTGSLTWLFTGTLSPGATGTVTFRVTVQ